MNIFAPFATDWYKPSHRSMYNQDTKVIFSNLTPRNDKNFAHYADKNARGVIVMGMRRLVIDALVEMWKPFFSMPKAKAVAKFDRMAKNSLGASAPSVDCWEDLHDLGYLPLVVSALPEGTLCPIGVPVFTVYNTIEKYFWLTNYVETVLSAESWKTMTNATAAFQYKRVATAYALATCDNLDHVNFQCHDFSLRGLSCIEDGYKSGIAHLSCFTGTDNIMAIEAVHEYYGVPDDQFVAGSIPASEHSVATTNIGFIVKENEQNVVTQEFVSLDEQRYKAEVEFLKHYITELFPSGFVSYVADSYDFWAIITRAALILKEEIMSRDGRVVFRPDSGIPEHIIAGYRIEEFETEDGFYNKGSFALKTEVAYFKDTNRYVLLSQTDDDDKEIPRHEAIGAVQCLWEIFGGEVNSKGYKVLDSHVGLIYGDSITVAREKDIFERLKDKGFASSNIVFGVGSYTYQYNTRDTFGFAVKATGSIIGDNEILVSKEPKTDPGKRSAKGFIKVVRDEDGLKLVDGLSFNEIHSDDNQLIPIFINGKVVIPKVDGKDETFEDIRKRVDAEVMRNLPLI